jgi:hypothetical protein
MAQALGHLPLKREPLNSNLCTTKKKKKISSQGVTNTDMFVC